MLYTNLFSKCYGSNILVELIAFTVSTDLISSTNTQLNSDSKNIIYFRLESILIQSIKYIAIELTRFIVLLSGHLYYIFL